jgi:glucokinase
MAKSKATQSARRPKLLAGVDIGGTKLHAVIAREDGTIVARARKKTKAQLGFEPVMDRVVECLEEACGNVGLRPRDLVAVGVGAPSPVTEDGRVVSAPNVGWVDVPLTDTLAKRFHAPVAAENDCNAGTYGEALFGAGRGARSLVGLFVGTGLGGGIMVNGEIIRGVNRLAAELGHMIVQIHGRRCGCGHEGCLEAYASKIGMGHRFHEEIVEKQRASRLTEQPETDLANVRSSVLAELYRSNDAVVREILDEAAWYLGVGVANVVTLLGPECVVLGGGVYKALGAELIDKVRKSAAAATFPPKSLADTRLVLSALGDDAVALGAMAYARERCATKRRPRKRAVSKRPGKAKRRAKA